MLTSVGLTDQSRSGVQPLLRYLELIGRLTAVDARRIEPAANEQPHALPELLEREGIISQKELALVLGEALQVPLLRRLHTMLASAETRASQTATRVAITMLLEDAMAKLADGAIPVRPRAASAEPSPAKRVEPQPLSRSFRALVVDDDPDLRQIVRAALEHSDLGLTVTTAQGGEEALALVALDRPDVVVLDLAMPEMDGFDACRRLRRDPRTAAVPVVVLTAMSTPEHAARARQAGADDFITKPFQRGEFIERIRRLIARVYPAG